jgi:hypothetical protein
MKLLTNPPVSLQPGSTIKVIEPDTTRLNYAQAGARFTTTLGSSDIGVQYYYGRLPQPAVGKISYSLTGSEVNVSIYKYNPYHQIGLDYAQVLFGFNIRAELAGNITEDLKGNDGTVYNPSLAWSFGFDRDIVLGINLNLQVNESILLLHDKLGSPLPYDKLGSGNISDLMGVLEIEFDTEGGLPLTATRLTAAVSRKFLRDELELRAAVVWGIEDKDCALMPAIIWTKDDIRFALSGGFFTGDSNGQLGQYHNNAFVKAALTYSF